MKGMLAVIPFALAVACGGSNGGNTLGGSNWLGTAWNGSVNTILSCPGQVQQTESSTYRVPFSKASDADFQYTSGAGCTYKFKVSGNTASLSNPPVSCSASGTTVTATWTSYTLTTSDGHHLTLTASGSATESTSQTTCPFSQTGTAAR
jgi:hypothetical protein